jgi:putative transposase
MNILYLSNSNINFRFDRIEDIYSTEREQKLVSIGAHCLMPNHFHILIKEVTEGGISKFIQKLLTAYSMYYNIKYERTGGLFEGKFKSEHLDTDIYLKYIFSYIHLNPIKLIEPKWQESGIKDERRALDFLNTYAYSSYQDFYGKTRKEKAILDLAEFPNYFPSKKHFQREILDWIQY